MGNQNSVSSRKKAIPVKIVAAIMPYRDLYLNMQNYVLSGIAIKELGKVPIGHKTQMLLMKLAL